jgi:hypothetical protein
MALRLAARIALAVAALTAIPSALQAQNLQRLTVESFVLSADTVAPQIDVPFHLIVTLRVSERVSEIDNLELPMLAQLELLGDERHTVVGPRGTQYREIITVAAHQYGPMAIAPATLQALDARDARAKQWFTNSLDLDVGASRVRIISSFTAVLVRALSIVAGVIALAILVGAVLLAVRLGRPRPRVVTPVVAQQPAPGPVLGGVELRRQRVQDALLVLRAERSRAAAVRVRGAFWRLIGASEGETLGDVLRRPASGEPGIRDVLIALERSAFTYDEDLPAAIDDTCASLERYAEALT